MASVSFKELYESMDKIMIYTMKIVEIFYELKFFFSLFGSPTKQL